MIRPARALALALLALTLFPPLSCTTKKERRPGPLTVWLTADSDEDATQLRVLGEDFKRQAKIPLELVLKTPYEMQFTVLKHPEDLTGVDVVEVDLFDLPEAARGMADVSAALEGIEGTERLYLGGFEAGRIEGVQRFIPWRLSWPALVVTPELAEVQDWESLVQAEEENPGGFVIPALDEREFYALLCAIIWGQGGDPADAGKIGPGLAFLARLSAIVSVRSGAIGTGSVAQLPREDRPRIFFEWPAGILALCKDASIPMDFRAVALPCGSTRCIPFFGRYLGSPATAPHPEDAARFLHFMISPKAQQHQMFASTWLPVRSDGWGDLAGREDGYHPLAVGGQLLRALPLEAKVREAVVKAGKMALFEGADPEAALEEYRRVIK